METVSYGGSEWLVSIPSHRHPCPQSIPKRRRYVCVCKIVLGLKCGVTTQMCRHHPAGVRAAPQLGCECNYYHYDGVRRGAAWAVLYYTFCMADGGGVHTERIPPIAPPPPPPRVPKRKQKGESKTKKGAKKGTKGDERGKSVQREPACRPR